MLQNKKPTKVNKTVKENDSDVSYLSAKTRHDLKNHLTAIKTLNYLLLSRKGVKEDEELVNALKQIDTKVDILTNDINKLSSKP
jgi:hypothetical protein